MSAHPSTKPFLQLEQNVRPRRNDIWEEGEDLPLRGEGNLPSGLRRTPLWLLLTLLFMNVMLSVWNAKAATKSLRVTQDESFRAEAGTIISPAEAIMRDLVENYVPGSPMKSPFIGEWRPAVDEAWSELLKPSTIWLSSQEMRAMNKSSVALKDGSGYVGYLETFHMLHCVKRFYQLANKDHYLDIQAMGGFAPAHLDHCLEILREGIMCNAEAKINTWAWQTPDELQGWRDGPRKCTDWEAFFSWADGRAIKYTNLTDFHAMLVPMERS